MSKAAHSRRLKSLGQVHGESRPQRDFHCKLTVARPKKRIRFSSRRLSPSTASRSDESEITRDSGLRVIGTEYRPRFEPRRAFDPRSDNSAKIKRVIATRRSLRAYALPEERDCDEFARQIYRTLQKPDDKPDRARLKHDGDGAEFPTKLETLRKLCSPGKRMPVYPPPSLSLSVWTMRISVLFVTGYSTAIRLLSRPRNVAVKH
jgi:hypothetical protein